MWEQSPGAWVDPACPVEWGHPLNVGLVGNWLIVPNPGWWGGRAARDAVQGGRKPNDGTLTNFATPTWTPPRREGGVSLSFAGGSSNYVDVAVSTVHPYTASFTLSAWIRPTAINVNQAILSHGTGAYYLRLNNANLSFVRSQQAEIKVGSAAYVAGRWAFVSATIDASGNVQLYTDGVADGTTGAAALNAPNYNLFFGAENNNGNPGEFWGGRLADVRIYGRALSGGEVAALHDQSRRGHPDTLRWMSTRAYSLPVAAGNTIATPTTLALVLTTFAPAASAPRLCTPTTKALVLTTFAPTVGAPRLCTPPTKALTITTFAPTVSTPRLCTPTTLSLTLATFVPIIARIATPTTLALVLTTFAPTVSVPRLCTPTTLALTLSTFAPTITAPRLCTPTTRALVLTAYAPTVSAPRLCTPAAKALTLTTFSPTVSAPRLCTPTTLALTLTTFAPAISGPQTATPTTRALVLTTYAPVISRVATPTTRALVLTTFAPTVSSPRLCTPTTLSLALTGYAPTVTGSSSTAVSSVALLASLDTTIALPASGEAIAVIASLDTTIALLASHET